jgi:RimJ/RimL family protein N-acetyltransferase
MNVMNYILYTERLTLDILKESDAIELWPYLSDPTISELMAWDAHKNIEETKLFLEGVTKSFEQGTAITWGIRLEGKIIGVFSIISIKRKHRSLIFNKAELAYWLGREFQGNGYMTEVGWKILEFSFNNLGLNKIYVGHHEGNKGSEGLITRLKFVFSHIEKEAFMKNGKWINVYYYEMLKKEYHKVYK